MKISEIIKKKDNKNELTSEEIYFAINGFLKKKIDRLNMIEFLRSINSNGMTERETFALTECMLNSGKTFKFRDINNNPSADKHSTGGVGDSTTLVIAPIIACAGVNFFKMSGLKLGFTGGTVDKLLCFQGYKPDISITEATKLLKKNGAVLMSFTDEIAPADKQIYQLRGEEGFMSIPLIASSVMSKKLASDSDVIVLDVKCGSGAFMKSQKEAQKLAKIMIKIGEMAGKKITAIISDMNQPLGKSIGSLPEVIEVIDVLKNRNNSRLRELSVYLSAKIIELAKDISFVEAKKLANFYLDSGKALKKFKTMIKDQGGSLDLFSEKRSKQLLKDPIILLSEKEGYIELDLEKIGLLVQEYCSEKNHGIKILVNLGDYLEKGTPVIELYGKQTKIDFSSCLRYSKNKKIDTNLIIDVI